MAADVLAYRAHEVPVGEDQREHIELMRDVAEDFNKRFGETLVVPEGNIPTVGARVRDLQEPEKKMSTTGGTPKGTVYIDEEPAAIIKKFKSAQTDSGREIVRARGQARDHEPDRDPRDRRAARRRPTSSTTSRARATATSRPPSARRSPRGWRPCASATWSCARTRRRSRPSSRPAPPRPRRSPRRWSRTCARRWASGPSARRRLAFRACGSPSSSWTSTSSRVPSTCCSR